MRKYKGQLGVVELLGELSAGLLGWDLINADDLNRLPAGTMSACHVHVELVDSSDSGHITVLLIHVDLSSSGLVSDQDRKVFHTIWVLLNHTRNRQHLTVGSLELLQQRRVVEELRLGFFSSHFLAKCVSS